MIRMPRLLDGRSTLIKGTLYPSSLSVTEATEELSTASMTLPGYVPEAKAGAWVRLYTPHGDAGVYVVQTVSTSMGTGEMTLELEHAFGTLAGDIIFEELTPDKVPGGNQRTVPVADLLRYALGKQSTQVWQLGRCEFTDAQGWTFTNPTILEIFETVTDSLQDWAWEFEMDTLPFTINLVKWQKNASCEMRMTRNISSMDVELDRSGMATRIYPIGANGLTLGDVPYVDKNVDVWGLQSKLETDVTIEDVGLLRAWANTRLEQLAAPVISVSVDGQDWSEATGEPMDRLAIGKVCRVPLPEYGTTVIERIVTLSWPDLIADESSVRITMANSLQGVTNVVRQLKRSGGGGSKQQAKETKRVWTEFEQTDEQIRLAAYNIGDLQTRTSELKVTADSITATVNKYNYNSAGDMLDSYYSNISQSAENIRITVSAITGKDTAAENIKTAMQELKASGFLSLVANGDMASAINQDASSVTIQASKINLQGYVTASQLDAQSARITHLLNGTTTAQLISCTSLRVGGRSYYNGTLTINGTTYNVVRWGAGD